MLLVVIALSLIIHGTAVTAAPLAAPPPTVVNVATEAQLQAAFRKLASDTTIVLAPGTYRLTRTLYISGTFTNVEIRGGTDRSDDVTLLGPGMAGGADSQVPYAIWVGGGVQTITIANLTIRDLPSHAIVFATGTQSPRVHNVHLIDAGRQFIMSNPDGADGGVDNGVVEYSVIEYTTTANDTGTGGVAVQGGANWTIRHNQFRNIVAAAQVAGPAVAAWNGSSGTLTEGNTFVDCARAIAYGLTDKPGTFDHRGGIIRNNFVYRSAAHAGDVAISVADSPDTQVVNNTIFLSGTYATPIEYRFAGTTGAVLANNLLDGFVWARDGAIGTELNNLSDAAESMFADAKAGDLHLNASATRAIDHGVTLAEVTDDWDGQPRPAGAAFDIGADEYATSATTTASAADAAGTVASGITSPAAVGAGAVAPATVSLFSASATPSRIEVSDANAVELGLRFRSDLNGTITGVRFYKGTTNTGTHFGHLWTNGGVRLASVRFTSETASGWQQATFSAPVPVTANTTYVVSYHTNVGQYGVTEGFFTNVVDNAPLHAPANGDGGPNGVYVYGASAFPTQTYLASNYWVDVVFVPSGGGDATAPTVTLTAPASGATVSGSAVITATAADDVGVVGVQFKLDGANLGAEVTASPYSLSWDTTTTADGMHTLTAVARDAAGNTATSASIAVTVDNRDTTAPAVALSAPASGATVAGTTVVTATASDNVGVVGVQFQLDGANLGAEVTASPYSLPWDTTTTADGMHTLTAVARDAAGNITTSAPSAVNVGNAPSQAPTGVAFQASTDNAIVIRYVLDVFADGSDPNTASPVASSDLGKPTPDANGDITVDQTGFFAALAPGTYLVTVSAVGSGGAARSAGVTMVR